MTHLNHLDGDGIVLRFVFLHSQIQTRRIAGEGWIGEESRHIDYDEHGNVVLISLWVETGGRLYPNGLPEQPRKSWWARLLSTRSST